MSKKIFSFTYLILSFILILFAFSIFISPLVSAGGIAGPVYEKLFFQPGLEKTYYYVVNSNTDKVMDHIVAVGGPLAQYFTLNTTVLKDMAPGEERAFTVKMKLPQELAPGEYIQNVCAAETKTRGAATAEGTSIGSKVVICAVISVFSPYPGKHADFDLKVENVSKAENATVMLEVVNQGTEPIIVHGVIDISSQNIKAGKEMKAITLYTDEKTLTMGQKTTLKSSVNVSEFEVGEYKAKATLFFDGNQTTKEKTFRVGELYMEIIDFTKELSKDKLNTIKVKVESKWNGPINNVYATLDVSQIGKNQIAASVNSPPVNFLPWGAKDMMIYWDTTGFEEGDYDAKVTLHYEDKTTVKSDIIKIKFAEGQIISFTTLLLLVLIVVVIVLILLIIKLMKRTRGQVKLKPVKLKRVKRKK